MISERHPLEPFIPENARVLFLGSFPPPKKRWCMEFFYPNWLNDHWRIEGLVFYADRDHFADTARKVFLKEKIVEHCTRLGIAFYDTATEVRRIKENASDKFLEVVQPTDIEALISRIPTLRAIVTTGEKATETLCETLRIATIPKVNTCVSIPSHPKLDLYRLPSSSRAYPLSLEQKAEAYDAMFSRYL